MGVVPNTKTGKIEFYEGHIDDWTTHALDIGLSVGEVGALAALITASRTSFTNQTTQIAAAKSATSACNNDVAAMHALGAALIQKIRVYAETNNNPNVFVLANIPAPASPSALPAPGICDQFEVQLLDTGALQLKWKCSNPTGAVGTVYEIRRKLSTAAPFVFIGAAGGDKTFVDDTVPFGSSSVFYQVVGRRSGLVGPSNTYVVTFGVGGGGGFTVSQVVEGAKLAA